MCCDILLAVQALGKLSEKQEKQNRGGCVMLGGHPIYHWCKMQQNVALSSGEAELNAALKGGA